MAFGGNATTITNAYNEAVRIIDDATKLSQKQKSDAKGVLAYFKEYAPQVLPFAIELVKKTSGL